MRKKSSIFAKNIYRDKEELMRKLKEEAKLLKERHPEIEEIILFGSIARGDFGYKSDADILIILKKSEFERYFDRIPKYLADFDVPIPVDIFPYTKEEIERMKKKGLVKRALEEGVKLA